MKKVMPSLFLLIIIFGVERVEAESEVETGLIAKVYIEEPRHEFVVSYQGRAWEQFLYEPNTPRRANNKLTRVFDEIIGSLGEFTPSEYSFSQASRYVAGDAFADNVVILHGKSSMEESAPSLEFSYYMPQDFSYIEAVLTVNNANASGYGRPTKIFKSASQLSFPNGMHENKHYWVSNPEKLESSFKVAITRVIRKFVAYMNGEPYVDHQPSLPISEQQSITDEKELTRLTELLGIEPAVESLEHIKELLSEDPLVMRNAAKRIGTYRLFSDKAVHLAEIKVLEKYLNLPTGAPNNGYVIDGLRWCALNLGRAKIGESREVLERVVQHGGHRKLKSSARKALAMLDK